MRERDRVCVCSTCFYRVQQQQQKKHIKTQIASACKKKTSHILDIHLHAATIEHQPSNVQPTRKL